MEKIKPKTESHLQAQVEHFANKGVKEFSNEQKLLLNNSSKLAKIIDLDNLPADLPEDLRTLIEEHKEEYINFLRSSKKEDILLRKENIELYNLKFKKTIELLKEKIANSQNHKELPEYLGSGSNGSAYAIEVNGEKYAAKFSRNIAQANFEIKPLLRAKGVENTAQLISYSIEDGVVIMNLLSGDDITTFTPENAPRYTDDHIIKLIETTMELYKKGIAIDPKPSNFIYDKKNGFSILDFHLSNGKSSIGDILMSLRFALTHRKWPSLEYDSAEYEEKSKEQSIERDKIYLPMMIRFITILKEKFPEALNDWKEKYQEKEKDPNIRQSPPINREYMQTDHPKLSIYLKRLEELGF